MGNSGILMYSKKIKNYSPPPSRLNKGDEMNYNISECVASVANIGHTKFVNICTGETMRIVEWGAMKWMLFPILILGFLTIAFCMYGLYQNR